MNDTVIDVSRIAPIDHKGWMELSKVEYQRLSDLLASLEGDDWDQQTDCPAWTVKDMVGHLLGAAEANASMIENSRQMVRGMSLRAIGLLLTWARIVSALRWKRLA